VFDPGSRWNEVGIHGIPRVREWEAVTAAESLALPGDEVHFVVAADGSVIVEEDVPDAAIVPLASALAKTLAPPYRARGVRQSESTWTVGGSAITVAELPAGFAGDELELVVRGGAETLHVDGMPAFDVPAPLRGVGKRHGTDYVVRARRLADTLWEVEAHAL
jgi:hypothetical protein